ncbi:MAG TPA: MerR family transcriptional regulator [Acidimicrobiia bacterium]|jgi:DNA-binding transcriptional MerR regulator
MTVREPHLPALAPHLSIGEVLEELRGEFPDVTISKIRFLESQGLIDPERTPSGYRKFSDGDLDRLRWILLQQRDHFLPLRVIKDRLDEFGTTGLPPREAPQRPRPPRPRAEPLPFEEVITHTDDEQEELDTFEPDEDGFEGELTRAELLEASGLTDAQLDELEDHGLLAAVVGAGERALYGEDALDIASLAAGFHARGIEARHLKMYKHFTEREAALFAQVLLPYQRQRNPAARARLVEELEELTRLGRKLRTAMLRHALRAELAE